MTTFVLVRVGRRLGSGERLQRSLRRPGTSFCDRRSPDSAKRVHLAKADIDLDLNVQYILNVLAYEDVHDVIVAERTYGGMAITCVAEHPPGPAQQLGHLERLRARWRVPCATSLARRLAQRQ